MCRDGQHTLSLGAFVVALGILITVHEFGHFWVARRCGVWVERFSIGFGPALWRKKDKQGTEYVLALIPLGGYVKMLDERAGRFLRPGCMKHLPGKPSLSERLLWLLVLSLTLFSRCLPTGWFLCMVSLA